MQNLEGKLSSRYLPAVFSLNDEINKLKKTLNEAVDKMAKVEVRTYFMSDWILSMTILLLRPSPGCRALRAGVWTRSWPGAGRGPH